MKKFLILLVSIIFISCDNEFSRQVAIISNNGCKFDVIEIDSCEYLMRTTNYHGYLAHKGNCKYCAERANLKEE